MRVEGLGRKGGREEGSKGGREGEWRTEEIKIRRVSEVETQAAEVYKLCLRLAGQNAKESALHCIPRAVARVCVHKTVKCPPACGM